MLQTTSIGEKYDNRRENLRICTQQQNTYNSKIRKNNTSGIIGIYWHKINKNWISYITINYKHINLGSFTDKEDAIKARKDAEIKYFGEFRFKGDD